MDFALSNAGLAVCERHFEARLALFVGLPMRPILQISQNHFKTNTKALANGHEQD
ncbi:MAG: hypothetical protein WDM89_11185 [Rhizomicrobium sp.]